MAIPLIQFYEQAVARIWSTMPIWVLLMLAATPHMSLPDHKIQAMAQRILSWIIEPELCPSMFGKAKEEGGMK